MLAAKLRAIGSEQTTIRGLLYIITATSHSQHKALSTLSPKSETATVWTGLNTQFKPDVMAETDPVSIDHCPGHIDIVSLLS